MTNEEKRLAEITNRLGRRRVSPAEYDVWVANAALDIEWLLWKHRQLSEHISKRRTIAGSKAVNSPA